MTKRIAHLSDLHLLGRSTAVGASIDLRTRFVSLARSLDPSARVERCVGALRQAAEAGADHLVVSGDLTELGSPGAFEDLAEVLAGSAFEPQQVTLVPGNHDRYGQADAFERALAGVLAPWARNASTHPGKVVDLGSVCLLPLDVTIVQSVARSRGCFSSELADATARAIHTLPQSKRVALVQHHPPIVRNPVADWFDGLVGADAERALLGERVQVLHGHLHEARAASLHGRPNVLLGAPAVVEDRDGHVGVQLYEVTDGGLVPRRLRGEVRRRALQEPERGFDATCAAR